MGIFSSPEHGACGIFAQDGWCGSQQVQDITFVRARSLLLGTAPVQNTAGEVLLSFATLGTYTLQPQPLPAGFTRMIAGQLVAIDELFFDFGFAMLEGLLGLMIGTTLARSLALVETQKHVAFEVAGRFHRLDSRRQVSCGASGEPSMSTPMPTRSKATTN